MKKEHWFLGGLILAALLLNLLLARPSTAETGPDKHTRYDLIVKDRVVTPKQAQPYTIISHFIWVDREKGTAKVFEWDQGKMSFEEWKRTVPRAEQ